MQKGSGIATIFFILILVGAIFSFTTGSVPALTPSNNETDEVIVEIPVEKTIHAAGWIPDWASDSGLESLKNNKNVLTNISPVWYEAQSSGYLKVNKPPNQQEIIDVAVANNIEITPSIALFDHQTLTDIYTDPVRAQIHIDDIVAAGSEPDIDGIDIDYESTKLSDKEGYFNMLEGIAAGLQPQGKKLVVTVLPQWGDDVRYLSFIETRQVQDWTRIASIADEVRIMAYDYTWQGSAFAGPIAPIEWQREILEYALVDKQVPPEKLVLGVHLYAYEKFYEKPRPAPYEFDALPWVADWEANKGPTSEGRAYTYATIEKIYRENEIVSEERYQGEVFARYSKVNDSTGVYEDRVVTYIDQDGVAERVELAREAGIKGVAFWRLGGESDVLSGI